MSKMRLTKRNISLVIALVIFVITAFQQLHAPKNQSVQNTIPVTVLPSASTSAQLAMVARVIDGDTIELVGGAKVRFIGINTPELHDPRKPVECFGREAMEENKRLVEGKQVRLEKEISETDKYKRLLRYVYLPSEASPSGIFINDYLVREGYAVAATFPPDVKFAKHFIDLQNEARLNKRGLWSKCR